MASKLSRRKVRFAAGTSDNFLDIGDRKNDDDETCLNEDMFADTITTHSSNYDEYSKVNEEESNIFNTVDEHEEQEKMETDGNVLNSSKITLLNQKRRSSSSTSLYSTNGNENKKRTSNKTPGHRRSQSGIQRLEYELSNLKGRLFDSLQEYEDFKDSFPDKQFPTEWEPPPVKDLRSKIVRLSMRIERETNKLKMKANDKEVKYMVQSILEHECDNDGTTNANNFGHAVALERFTVSEIINNDTLNESSKEKALGNIIKYPRTSAALTAPFGIAKIPEELKTRQRSLFMAGAVPPRTPSEREASQAALHCALSRLPPISTRRRTKARHFDKTPAAIEAEKAGRGKLVMVPNKRRLANGRAFVHERQKEFVSFHKRRFHDMDVTFTRTAFEGSN